MHDEHWPEQRRVQKLTRTCRRERCVAVTREVDAMTLDGQTGFERRPSPSRAPLVQRARHLGTQANARLTSSTALVLLVLLAIEGVTVVRVGSMLTLHVFIGMLLVPPVLVKLASTFWRFAKYYTGSREYREKGPPPAMLRLLGPFVAITTIILFASGIVLLLGPTAWRGDMSLLHKASFVVWFACMTVHVLGHFKETAQLSTQDWVRRTRARVAGSRSRRLVITTSLASGVLLAFATIPSVGHWVGAR